jgi:hypothetical protein
MARLQKAQESSSARAGDPTAVTRFQAHFVARKLPKELTGLCLPKT